MMPDVLTDASARMRRLLDDRPAAYGPWAREIELTADALDRLRELIELGERPASWRDVAAARELRRRILVSIVQMNHDR